jgi:hypothetical protein
MEQGLTVLASAADHFQATIEGQLRSMLTDEQRLSSDFAAARRDIGCTYLDLEIDMFRKIEAVLGTAGRDGPLWLNDWIDNWPPLTETELDAFQDALEPVAAVQA